MATFKHISSKNADYGAAEQYLTFEHDEFTMKPTLDENGRLMLREDYRIATLNCGDEDFAVACIPAFKVVSVFDVSQTEGEPLPSIAVNELSGSVQDYQDFFKALEQASPVPIGFEDIEGGAHGYFHLLDNRIAIQEGMSQLQTIKTAIHEIAHAKLHAIDPTDPEQTNRPDSRNFYAVNPSFDR